jgi:hypothetical protein
MTAQQQAREQARRFVDVAPVLAEQALGGSAKRYAPRGMSTFASWFTDTAGTTLTVVVPPGQTVQALDTVLAHALAHQHDRDLLLVVEPRSAATFLHRLHRFTSTVRVLTYDDAYRTLTPQLVPARAHVLDAYRALPARPIVRHDIPTQQRKWVEPLIAVAEGNGAEMVRMRRYVSWHKKGLQVLRLTSGSQTLHVMAGVQYRKPPAGRIGQDAARVDAAEACNRLKQWVKVVESDCTTEHGRSATVDPAEHRLQSRLSEGHLGLLPCEQHLRCKEHGWEREHFGYRGPGREGFIDFLGIDAGGDLHVVETKVGADAGVLLQALDYATWVQANEAEVRRLRGWPAEPTGKVHVDLVLARKAPGHPPVSGYLAGQLEVLSGDVPLRVFVIDDPDGEELVLEPVAARDLFGSAFAAAAPVAARRWAARAEEAIRSSGGLARVHRSAAEALLPAALTPYDELRTAKRLHRWVLSTRSSQAFALNLFAPLDESGRIAVLRALGLAVVQADPVVFEYEEAGDALRERSAHGRHQTQVDVVITGRDAAGRSLAAFVEVKLTEPDFGHCSAFERASGPTLANCHSEGLFGADSAACWQLQNKGGGHPRRYDVALEGVPVLRPAAWHADGGCFVRTGRSQPMRNLALAHHWLEQGRADQMVFALCAPSGHQAIWRRLAELREVFPDTPARAIVALDAGSVAAAHPDGGAALRARYPDPVL